jgi:hypothetical protein
VLTGLVRCLGEPSESLLGEIPVFMRLSMGAERLSLFLTSSRILVAHVGKRGTGAAATASIFGKLGGGLEDLFKGGRESVHRRRATLNSPESILAADKDNFSISYEEVVSVDVVEGFRSTGITLVTRDDKLQFSSGRDFDTVVGLLGRNLGPKLTSKRLPT